VKREFNRKHHRRWGKRDGVKSGTRYIIEKGGTVE